MAPPPVPPPVPPDTKDWTWVLARPCPECGFDASGFAREDVGVLVRENARAWPPLLAGPGAATRPAPEIWSALEYACHVRDVFRIYEERLRRMLTEDGPHYENWDQDATAVADRYDAQDPRTVGAELVAAGDAVAARFDGVRGDAWARTGFRSDGAAFTVETFARYFVHDPVHHLREVADRNG
jgi:hypothetical protein